MKQSETGDIFSLCRSNKWRDVLRCVRINPAVAMIPMIMQNNIATTLLHQAITSKSDETERATIVLSVLQLAPQAATMKNGYGSLPLHVLAQRNVKMNSSLKEEVILALITAHSGALMEQGGIGKRTPLHIAFTDYISPNLAKAMIDIGRSATFMKDKKGWLPLHVACNRHCSPEKLQMLINVNPASLYETTNDGQTPLNLAISSATKSHPNYALIEKLERLLKPSAQNISSSPTSVIIPINYHDRYPQSPCSLEDLSPPRRIIRRLLPPYALEQRKVPVEEVTAAHLLLHFHRNTDTNEEPPEQVAQV